MMSRSPTVSPASSGAIARHKNLPRWEHADLCHDPTVGAYVGEQVIVRYDPRDVRKSGHIICRVTAIPLRARGLGSNAGQDRFAERKLGNSRSAMLPALVSQLRRAVMAVALLLGCGA